MPQHPFHSYPCPHSFIPVRETDFWKKGVGFDFEFLTFQIQKTKNASLCTALTSMDCADDILGTRWTYGFDSYGFKYDGTSSFLLFFCSRRRIENVYARNQKQNILNGLPSTYSDEKYNNTEKEINVSTLCEFQ